MKRVEEEDEEQNFSGLDFKPYQDLTEDPKRKKYDTQKFSLGNKPGENVETTQSNEIQSLKRNVHEYGDTFKTLESIDFHQTHTMQDSFEGSSNPF